MTIDSSYLYTGTGGPGEIRVIDVNTKNLIYTINTKNDVKSISVSEKFVLTTMKDKIQIYDKFSNRLLKEITEQGSEVNDAKFYASYIIYSSRDQIKIIDSASFELLKSIKYQRIVV